jgi:hypothetical protein
MIKASTRIMQRVGLVAAIVLLPFNSVPWWGSWLGELSGEAWVAGAVLLLAVVGLEAVGRGRIRLPRTFSWYLLAAWLTWAVFSSLLAAALSSDLVFKGRTVFEKAALQVAVAAFGLAVAVACYGAFKSQWESEAVLAFFRTAVHASLVVPLLWAVLEGVAISFPDSGPAEVLRRLSQLIHVKP